MIYFSSSSTFSKKSLSSQNHSTNSRSHPILSQSTRVTQYCPVIISLLYSNTVPTSIQGRDFRVLYFILLNYTSIFFPIYHYLCFFTRDYPIQIGYFFIIECWCKAIRWEIPIVSFIFIPYVIITPLYRDW